MHFAGCRPEAGGVAIAKKAARVAGGVGSFRGVVGVMYPEYRAKPLSGASGRLDGGWPKKRPRWVRARAWGGGLFGGEGQVPRKAARARRIGSSAEAFD